MTVVNCSAQSHEAVSARYSCDPMSPCHREPAAPKRLPALKPILRRLGVRCRQSRPGRILATFKEEHPRTYKDDQQAQSISWDSFAKHSAHEIGCISCADPLQDVRPVEVALTAGEQEIAGQSLTTANLGRIRKAYVDRSGRCGTASMPSVRHLSKRTIGVLR